MSGIFKSVSTRSNEPDFKTSSASMPLEAARTEYPSSSNSSVSTVLMLRSSSTSKMRLIVPLFSIGPKHDAEESPLLFPRMHIDRAAVLLHDAVND